MPGSRVFQGRFELAWFLSSTSFTFQLFFAKPSYLCSKLTGQYESFSWLFISKRFSYSQRVSPFTFTIRLLSQHLTWGFCLSLADVECPSTTLIRIYQFCASDLPSLLALYITRSHLDCFTSRTGTRSAHDWEYLV